MNKVAKLVMIDNDNKYLMMYRNDHPTFGDDPDLPGGTLETGEQPLDTMIREVYEEAGITVDGSKAQKLYEGVEYSNHTTLYSLYTITLDTRPIVSMSWEHSRYEWLEKDTFLAKAKNAKDTYMHMVYDVLK